MYLRDILMHVLKLLMMTFFYVHITIINSCTYEDQNKHIVLVRKPRTIELSNLQSYQLNLLRGRVFVTVNQFKSRW